MKRLIIPIAAFLLLLGQAHAQSGKTVSNQKKETMNKTEQPEHYTFTLSDKVTRQAVTFKNRFGITVSGDLYTPKNSGNQKRAAILLSGPFGAVKEQSSGLYANELAARGFVTLAFDPSFRAKVVETCVMLAHRRSLRKTSVPR